MTPTTRRTRQYRVTHIPTGIVTVVNAEASQRASGRWDACHSAAATTAGLRPGSDVLVTMVREGQEIPLPWGCLPLVLRPRVACAS